MPKVCPVCGTSFTDSNIFCPADGSTLRAAESTSDLIGTVIADRYLVTDLLGAGGMGTVYLAQHVRLPQRAAIKVLRPEMVRDAGAVARFNREAANASRIEHERIARVFDFGETADGTVYLAMEYVPGRTLKQIIKADGAIAPERTATIARQVGDALDAAHRLGIVHRDLKPDNVMVIEDAEFGDRCKVVDFGIAKAIGGGNGEPGLTQTGFIVGTPDFMSPEQLFGNDIDHRSDVYALALVCFQCLTGRLPFDSSTPEKAMTARLTGSPESLAGARGEVDWPAAVQEVFDRGLARDREQRFGSAGEFARTLEAEVSAWVRGESRAVTGVVSAPGAASGSTSAVGAGAAGATGAVGAGSGASGVGASGGRATGGGVAAESAPAAAAARAVGSSSTTSKTMPAATRGKPPLVMIGTAGVLGIAALAWVFTRGPEQPATAPPDGLPTVSQVPPDASLGDVGADDNALRADATDASSPANDSRGTSGDAPDGGDTAATLERATRSAAADQSRGSDRIVANDAPSTTPSVPPAASAASALRTLDSIRLAVDPATATAADARRSVAALRGLMPRLGTAEDSAWAYLREAEAHFIMNDGRSACLTLTAARPLVRTDAQRRVLVALSPMC